MQPDMQVVSKGKIILMFELIAGFKKHAIHAFKAEHEMSSVIKRGCKTDREGGYEQMIDLLSA